MWSPDWPPPSGHTVCPVLPFRSLASFFKTCNRDCELCRICEGEGGEEREGGREGGKEGGREGGREVCHIRGARNVKM